MGTCGGKVARKRPRVLKRFKLLRLPDFLGGPVILADRSPPLCQAPNRASTSLPLAPRSPRLAPASTGKACQLAPPPRRERLDATAMVGSPPSDQGFSIFDIFSQLGDAFCGDPKAGLAPATADVLPAKDVKVRPMEGFAKRGAAVAALRGRNSEGGRNPEASPLPAPRRDSGSPSERRSADAQSEAVTLGQNLLFGDPQSAPATAGVSRPPRRQNLPALDASSTAPDAPTPPPPPTNASAAQQEQENPPAVSREPRGRSHTPEHAGSGASPGVSRRGSTEVERRGSAESGQSGSGGLFRFPSSSSLLLTSLELSGEDPAPVPGRPPGPSVAGLLLLLYYSHA